MGIRLLLDFLKSDSTTLVLTKPVQMTDIVVDEMLELCLVWDALDEVDEDAIDLLIEKMVKLLL